MPTYNDVKYLTLPQQVEKNRLDIATLEESIEEGAVGPQGTTGPRGPQGVQGIVGPAGPDGTPVAGLSYTSDLDPNVSPRQSIYWLLADVPTGTHRFMIEMLTVSGFSKLSIYIDDVLKTETMSTLDNFVIQKYNPAGEGYVIISFYDETGNKTEVISNPGTTSISFVSDTTYQFKFYEVLAGSTVGPTGPAGADGAQGATGPTGAQGVQGLPGLKNMAFLASYINEATFTPYAYRVMVQIVGGDYDGLTFIKEDLINGDTVKFGPYATLVSIETNGGVIQCILENGVTSIRVYKVDNIS